MYKTRNTETGNGIRGTRRMEGKLFRGMLPTKCLGTFPGMPTDIPTIAWQHSLVYNIPSIPPRTSYTVPRFCTPKSIHSRY